MDMTPEERERMKAYALRQAMMFIGLLDANQPPKTAREALLATSSLGQAWGRRL